MRLSYLLLCIVFALSACGKELSPQYFIEHPDYLKKMISKCDVSNQSTKLCQTAFQAVDLLNELLPQLEQDPEAFGNKILRAEESCYGIKVDNSQLSTTTLKPGDNFPTDPCEQVKILLAVEALTTPE